MMVLMFQREVAERIVAPPGSKTYGRLSVLAQWRCDVKLLFDIAPSAFVPPPKVTSSLVRLVPKQKPLPCDRRQLERVTAGGLRPAAQNAAPEPEGSLAGPGTVARRCRDRTYGACGGNPR